MPVVKETVMHKEKECYSKENPVSKEAVRKTFEHRKESKDKIEEAFKQLNAFIEECRSNNIPLNSGKSCDTAELVEELFS